MFSLTNRTRLVAGYTVLLQMETPGGGVPPVFLLSQISSRPRIPFIKNSEHFVFSITSAVVTSAQVISSINIFSNGYGIPFFALQVAPSTEALSIRRFFGITSYLQVSASTVSMLLSRQMISKMSNLCMTFLALLLFCNRPKRMKVHRYIIPGMLFDCSVNYTLIF
jgi:hypothetical protein